MFNVLLIVRAPLQLFQAIQTSILPHLAGLEARESADEFHRAIRLTILVIAAFAGAVALGLLADRAVRDDRAAGRQGLPLRPARARARRRSGWACTSSSGTLNQAALARGRARLASIAGCSRRRCSSCSSRSPTISAEVTRVEVGYFVAALVLCGLLWVVYRLGRAAPVARSARSASAG